MSAWRHDARMVGHRTLCHKACMASSSLLVLAEASPAEGEPAAKPADEAAEDAAAEAPTPPRPCRAQKLQKPLLRCISTSQFTCSTRL